MDDWIRSRNIERFEALLATDLGRDGRATITNLLDLERAKQRQLPRTKA